MSSKIFSLSLLLGVLFGTLPDAHAVTFDFVAFAAGNEHGAFTQNFTSGGLSLSTTALHGQNAAYVYLDDLSGGQPGGLGVCTAISNSGECIEGVDDNIGANEYLTLTFSSPVDISTITFSNGDHLDLYSGNFGVKIDGAPGFTAIPQAAVYAGSLFGTTFTFISNATYVNSESAKNVIYISSLTANAVPEPFTMGLVGLGLVPLARRRLRAL